jgi:hypothetical protein
MFVSGKAFDNIWAEHDNAKIKKEDNMFISREKYKELQQQKCDCYDITPIKKDLRVVAETLAKAYMELNRTKYYVDEKLDKVAADLEDLIYNLTTHEVLDD